MNEDEKLTLTQKQLEEIVLNASRIALRMEREEMAGILERLAKDLRHAAAAPLAQE